jgi:hypothetical protein
MGDSSLFVFKLISAGIVRLRTKATEFSFSLEKLCVEWVQLIQYRIQW